MCNLVAKRERERKISAMMPEPIEILLNQILKIETVDHKEIQLQLQSIFRSLGYFVKLEKKIQARRPGRIDLFARKGSFSLGIEIDHSVIRWKSIDKLNTLRPNLAIFILKSKNINIEGNKRRLSFIRVRSLFINLPNNEILRLKQDE